MDTKKGLNTFKWTANALGHYIATKKYLKQTYDFRLKRITADSGAKYIPINNTSTRQ